MHTSSTALGSQLCSARAELAVHVLGRKQLALAALFVAETSDDINKFTHFDWHTGRVVNAGHHAARMSSCSDDYWSMPDAAIATA